jgi:hypothetical protein
MGLVAGDNLDFPNGIKFDSKIGFELTPLALPDHRLRHSMEQLALHHDL